MIIACPACSTRYVVPDTAIGPDGRTVRCAKCRHSWFQHGPEDMVPDPRVAEAAPSQSQPQSQAQPRSQPEPPAPAAAAPVAEQPAPVRPAAEPPVPAPAAEAAVDDPPLAERPYERPQTGYDDDEARSSFEHEVPFRPRRNPARLWTAAALAFALVMAALAGSVWWFGMPDWLPWNRPAFGPAVPDLEMSFPPTKQDRRTLPNGAEYFGASGTITNIGKEVRSVPSLLIVLLDSQNKVVDHREIAPPKPSLQPGESVTVNEALTDVPRSAVGADIGWKAE